jgi:hypothetical protein
MPIGFSDILKTTAQLTNNLTKGIVSTDDTYGGVRSKIDDWTDLHTSTYNGGSGYTFQDEGTGAAPGHFKAYSTMFYVADGRALIETATASGAIMLDGNGEYVSSGGQLYTHDPSGTPEPEYWVLIDPTQIGGSGAGTDKLPKFTITGTQGASSTAVPAGYQKLQVLTNAAASDGAVTEVTSATTNQLTVATGTSTPALSIVTAAVADAGTSLATGDQIYDFVVGYADPIGTDNSTDVAFNSTITDVLTLTDQAVSATDPGNVDVIAGWDHSANKFTYLSASDVRAAINVDPLGTDNSTDVTLASVASNYLSLTDQVITAGTVPVTLGGTGLTTIAAGSLLQATSSNTISALTGGSGTDGYLLSYDHSSTAFQLVAATATANDSEITLSGGTGITFSNTFTTNQSADETINVTLAAALVDIAGLNGTGLLSISGTDVTIDSSTYLTSETSHADVLVDGEFATAGIMATDGSGSYSIVTNNSGNWDTAYSWGNHASAGYLLSETFTSLSVDPASGTTTYNIPLLAAGDTSTATGVYIESTDFTFTHSTTADRGKLTTGDLLVKGNLTVLGDGTLVNLQQENLIVKDPNIILGAVASEAGTISTASAGDVGITAYIDGTDDPALTYNKTDEYWELNNRDHGNAPTLKIAQKYTVTASSVGATEAVTHHLNTRDVIVQARNSATDEIVYVKYECNSLQQTTIYFGSGAQGLDIKIVIIG